MVWLGLRLASEVQRACTVGRKRAERPHGDNAVRVVAEDELPICRQCGGLHQMDWKVVAEAPPPDSISPPTQKGRSQAARRRLVPV